MQFRRILLALALSTTVGLTAACAQDTEGTDQGAAAATSAAASPSVDLKANTEAVCKGVVAAYEAEKTELATVLGEFIAAGVKEDKTALAAAKAKGEVVLARLTKAVNAELTKAADPAAKAAIEKYVATYAKFLQTMDVDDAALETELDKAIAEAGKYCPALAE